MIALIEKDHLGDWSPEKDCCLGPDVSTNCAEAIFMPHQHGVAVGRFFKPL